MDIYGFFKNVARAVRLARKPSWSEFKLSLRVVLLGLALLGSLGFLFQLVGSTFQFARLGPVPRDVAVVVLGAMTAIMLGAVVYARRRYRL